MSDDHLAALSLVLGKFEGAEVLTSNDPLGAAAIELAVGGFEVFPCAGKYPAIPKHPDCKATGCMGGCGRLGHGVLDATSDTSQIAAWWSGSYAGANIGARVPRHLCVLDVDPRNGGLDTLAEHEQRHGPLPPTLTVVSGRGDGGCHYYWEHPGGKPTRKQLGAGLDIKTHSGYCIMPISLHPDSRKPYEWVDPTVTPRRMPVWLRLAAEARDGRAQKARTAPWRGDASALVSFVRRQSEGNRNDALYWAASRAVETLGDSDDLDALLEKLKDAAVETGQTEAEAEATIKSARKHLGAAA